MIKRLLLFLIVLILAVWIGLTIKENPGYVLLAYGNWTIETPLWFGILIIAIAFFLLYWLLRLLRWTLGLTRRIDIWRKQKKLTQAQRLTNEGLIAFSEGNWRNAEKKLQRSTRYLNRSLINYLASAYAAQEQGDYQRRDDYLRRAHQMNPQAKIAIGLTQARLQLEHHQLEQALATLKHLRDLIPNHKFVLKLLKKVYLELQDWQELKSLLPTLRKQKIINAQEADDIEAKILQCLLTTKIQNNIEYEELYGFWHSEVPKKLQYNPTLVSIYVKYLIKNHHFYEAEKMLRETLRKNWNADLIKLYSQFFENDGKKQLAQAEAWLKIHKTDPSLLLTLGRLSINNQLWGKAKNYLEASLFINPTPEAYNEMAQLCEQLNENEAALEYYRKAMAIQTTSAKSS